MNLLPLTPEQRIEASESAKAYIIRLMGDQPTPEQFEHGKVSKYPAWVIKLIAVMLAIVVIAAAFMSLFRLFTIGRDYFLMGINEPLQGAIVGMATFLLAEFLVILSTISAKILYKGRARLLFVIPVVMGLSMAVVGNVTFVKPHDLFSWLDALIPVFAVLFISFIGEKIILEAIEQRHESQRAYEQAMVEYRKATSRPESHPQYSQAHANAIKQLLIATNSKGTGATQRKEYMSTLTGHEWVALVKRELLADEWYAHPDAVPAPSPKPVEVATIPNPFGQIHPEQGVPEYIPTTPPAMQSTNGHTVNGNGKHS